MEKEELPKPADNRTEKELAALSYLWIFSIPVLLAKRDSVFIQHHARRGFVLFLLSLILWFFPILRLGEFVVLALVVLGFIKAAMGDENTFPVLSEIADGTMKLKHLKSYWHHTKHGAIKIVKPDHKTPSIIKEELREQERELTEQEKLLEKERRMVELEERKLSALHHRVTEDEKRLDSLADEVHTLEKEVDELKK
jgi:uncharacterized membrane protein